MFIIPKSVNTQNKESGIQVKSPWINIRGINKIKAKSNQKILKRQKDYL